ncbi:MAG TPA: major capsid protein [Armatimonadota bacterium]|jgi:hypothetical protein
MPVSIFEPRTLLGVWEQTKQAKKFLQSFLFGHEYQSTTEHIDLDEVTHNRIMAPFVSLTGRGKTIARTGFRMNTYTPPKLAPNFVTTAQDLGTRQPGETLYDGKSPEQRDIAQVQHDLAKLDDIITRRTEWMCRETLFGGLVHMVGDDYDETLDFGLTMKENLNEVVGAKLFNAEGALPLNYLGEKALAVAAETGVMPTSCIMAMDVLLAFRANAQVKEAMNTTMQAIIALQPRDVPEGGRYIMTVDIPEIGPLDIYTYAEWFEDGATRYPMVPNGYLALVNPQDSFVLAYGAYTDLSTTPAVTYAVNRYPRSWYEPGPNQRFLEMVSRPLPAPTRTNAWYVAKVL